MKNRLRNLIKTAGTDGASLTVNRPARAWVLPKVWHCFRFAMADGRGVTVTVEVSSKQAFDRKHHGTHGMLGIRRIDAGPLTIGVAVHDVDVDIDVLRVGVS